MLSGGFILLAGTFVVIGRRCCGAAHIIRSLFGILGILVALMLFSDSWSANIYQDQNLLSLFEQEQFGQALNIIFNKANGEPIVFASILFMLSIVILAWPPKQRSLKSSTVIIQNQRLN